MIREINKVILVESIGDMLALWEAGVKNSIVTFGLEISLEILNQLLRMDVDKITISFNNDEGNNDRGNIAAYKGRKKLLKYFDSKQVEIKLPSGYNDFGEMPANEIKTFFELQ
jgi:DNA primase